mmetsp:Transcript_30675/g.89210  ORF Transcript_30675/g.89210 Transcript_30675/m.89210 type:complete len:85 (-) Transcript_30675:1991-2245(-)
MNSYECVLIDTLRAGLATGAPTECSKGPLDGDLLVDCRSCVCEGCVGCVGDDLPNEGGGGAVNESSSSKVDEVVRALGVTDVFM